MVEGGAAKASSAVYFNPVQCDMQWIRRVQKEERILMDAMQDGGKAKQPNKVDDVYQHFGSAYFYQSEYLKNHMYINDGPPGGIGYPFKHATSQEGRREACFDFGRDSSEDRHISIINSYLSIYRPQQIPESQRQRLASRVLTSP